VISAGGNFALPRLSVSNFPVAETVKIIECPRDAWQGLPRIIPTDRKVEYLRGLIAAGFRHIDAVSFVSPKVVPQMADSEQVLEELGTMKDIEIIGIVVNERGAERAITTGLVTTLGYPCSVSETFLRRNQNQSLHENQEVLKRIKRRADDAGVGMVAYISMAFGNPYGDPWSEDKLAEAAKCIAAIGIASISIADTVGAASADLVRRVVAAVLPERGNSELGIHLHSTRAQSASKILAAYDAGCRRLDAAIGGLGGCPLAQDQLVGNIPTEEVLRVLEQRGVKIPIDLSKTASLNAAIGEEFSS